MNPKIICVVNNYDIFNVVINKNENLNDYEIFSYDNTKKNISITQRYNDFIEKNIISIKKSSELNPDFWCLFMHQDFGFLENIRPILDNLDYKYIYGATGIKVSSCFAFKNHDTSEFEYRFEPRKAFGRILQGNNDYNFTPYGNKIDAPTIVDAVDCCCIIIHSSIMKKYELRFDENLEFHMYAEELCYRAKKDYNIETKVVQLPAFHMGKGDLNEEFKRSVQYLKNKFNITEVPSTCPN